MSQRPDLDTLRIQEKLSSPVPYAECFRGSHPRLGRELEVRVQAGGPEAGLLFREERDLLLESDHPSLPPVLRVGEQGGRELYVVPWRRTPERCYLSRSETLDDDSRRAVIRGVASVLGALESRGVFLRGLHPSLVTWDPARGVASLPFPLAMQGYPRFGGLSALPPSLLAWARTAGQLDVACWALLSHFVLTGEYPEYPEGGGRPRRISSRFRVGDEVLVEVLEACLTPGPESPSDAEELLGALRSGDEASAFHDPDHAFPAEPGLPHPRPGTPESAPAGGERRRLGATLALGLGVGLLASFGEGTGEVPLPPGEAVEVGPARHSSGAGGGEARSQAPTGPVVAPELRDLLRGPPVTPASFPEVVSRLRKLSRKKQIPPGLDDPIRFGRILRQARRDPARGARELDAFLARMRRSLDLGARA